MLVTMMKFRVTPCSITRKKQDIGNGSKDIGSLKSEQSFKPFGRARVVTHEENDTKTELTGENEKFKVLLLFSSMLCNKIPFNRIIILDQITIMITIAFFVGSAPLTFTIFNKLQTR